MEILKTLKNAFNFKISATFLLKPIKTEERKQRKSLKKL